MKKEMGSTMPEEPIFPVFPNITEDILSEREKCFAEKSKAAYGEVSATRFFEIEDAWRVLSHPERYSMLLELCKNFTVESCDKLAEHDLVFLVDILPVEVGQQLVAKVTG